MSNNTKDTKHNEGWDLYEHYGTCMSHCLCCNSSKAKEGKEINQTCRICDRTLQNHTEKKT